MGAWVSLRIGKRRIRTCLRLLSWCHRPVAWNVDQPLFLSAVGGPGFLPSKYQGRKRFRGGSDPVLYLSDPPGVDKGTRRRMLDGLGRN